MTKDKVHGLGHSPVCQILSQIVVRAVITSSLPAWTSSVEMLSTLADFHFFSDYTVASNFLRRMAWSSSGSVWGPSSTNRSPLALWVYSSVQYSSHLFSISRSPVKHFPERSRTVLVTPCFTVVKSFTIWYALLLLFFLRFSSISLHSSPIQFSFAFFMHLLILLLFTSLYFSDPSGSNRFFLSSLLLWHRSRITAVTQFFFLLTMFAKDLTGCFNHCCVEGGDHWIQVCGFIVHDSERCKPPTSHSLEGVISSTFNRKYLCILW